LKGKGIIDESKKGMAEWKPNRIRTSAEHPKRPKKMKKGRRKEREIRERGKKPKLGMEETRRSEIRGERNGRENLP